MGVSYERGTPVVRCSGFCQRREAQVGCVLKVEPNPSGLATCQTEAGPSEGPACDEADEVPPEPLPSEEGTT